MVDAEEKMLFRGFLWQMCQNIGVGGMGGCGRTGGVRGRVGVGERVGVGGRVHGCVQHIKMGPAAEVCVIATSPRDARPPCRHLSL